MRRRIHDIQGKCLNKLIVGNDLLAYGFFQTVVRRRKYKLGSTEAYEFLRLAEYIFPPPHPRLKETIPQGVIFTIKVA